MKAILAITFLLSLSEQQVADYLAGAGMGLGRTGEVHGYPGPKHVLELADQLQVTPEQKRKMEALMKTMRENASRLGEQIVAKERELDHLFATGKIDPTTLTALTDEIGRLQGQLRAVHLRTHLEAKPILTADQIHRYMQARGHAEHKHSGHH